MRPLFDRWTDEAELGNDSFPLHDLRSPRYDEMLAAAREVLDRLAGAAPAPAAAAILTAKLNEISEYLAGFAVEEPGRFDGRRGDLPGRGSLMIPPYVLDSVSPDAVRARVTFGRYYLGRNTAAHGGTHGLLFDDILGRMVNYDRSPLARTVSLTVNYRKIAKVGVEFRLEAEMERVEGRKRWAVARLIDPAGDTVADAIGLFVALRAGQQ